MPAFRIRYVEWLRRPGGRDAEGPFFEIYPKEGERSLRCVYVPLSRSDIPSLKHEMHLQGPEGDTQFERAVIRYAIQRIEQALREDIFPNPPSDTTDCLSIKRDDHPMLRQMLQEKTCSYQIKEGRDLLCSAASEADETSRGKIGLRSIAPTSRSICHACTMPDTDYLCSHFLHPEVLGKSNRGIGLRRHLNKGLCDIGRDEVQQPELCHAAGSQCWEWLIEPIQEQIAIPSSPLALPEALDFLDTAWRVAFGKKRELLKPRGITNNARLSQPCATREEFEAGLSALTDIMKNIDIPDDLLNNTAIQKHETVNRLSDCLKKHLADPVDHQDIENAADTLRSVNKIRNALQHSGASTELLTIFSKLGISYPPQWGSAWDRIRAATIEALRIIREKVLIYADNAT
jgi:hypothetical protein